MVKYIPQRGHPMSHHKKTNLRFFFLTARGGGWWGCGLLLLGIVLITSILLGNAASAATITSAASGYWNDVGTWVGGTIPSSTDSVVISSGHTVLFDRNDTSTTCSTIEIRSGGILKFDSTPSNPKTMQVKGDINVYGKLELVPGSTLKIECETNGQYGIIVYSGGELKGTGSVPTVLTTLTSPLAVGGQTITVADASGFGVGDIITLGASLYAEGFKISSISGNRITLDRKAIKSQSFLNEVYKNATVTTSNISAGSRTFSVANLGGIKEGDAITIATTSQPVWAGNHWEIQTENRIVEAIGSSTNSITVSEPFSYAHNSGAIVLKTNRDTVISATIQDGSKNGYIRLLGSSFLDISYLEIRNMETTVAPSANVLSIKGNSFHNNNYGLYLDKAKDISIISNLFFDNHYGLWLNASAPDLSEGNYIISNFSWLNMEGITIKYAYRNLILNNYFFSNEYCGFWPAWTYSSDNLMYGNSFFSNLQAGVKFYDGINNLLVRNNFFQNQIGIDYEYSKFNTEVNNSYNSNFHSSLYLWTNRDYQRIIDSHFTDDWVIRIYYAFQNLKTNIYFYGCSFAASSKFNLDDTNAIISLKHNKIGGLTKIYGDYKILPNEARSFNYSDNSYRSFCTTPILFRGVNHAISIPETDDAVTTTEVWWVTYRSFLGAWEVVGSVSGLQSNQATSGVPYISDKGQVKFTITQNSPQEGDQFIFVTVAAAGDANVQKKILFGPTRIAELNHQSRLVVNPGGKIELKGTADFPTLVDYDGTGGYGFVISGEVDAEYFDFNQINGDGVKIEPTATITKFDNGSIRNVSGLGPHLSINGKDHTFNYLNFDNTGAYDVRASNDANLVFVRSQRGKFIDSISDTSSVSWDDPVLGFTVNNVLGTCTADVSTGVVTIPFKIKDPNSSICTFKSGSAQYSVNDSMWRTIPDSSLSGISGTFGSATSFASAPVNYLYWSSKDQLPSTFESANVKFRFRVNNGYVYGDFGSSEGFTVDFVSPAVAVSSPNGGEYWAGGSTHNITWTVTDGGSGVKDNSISIYYTTGEGYVLIAENEANDGIYSWTLPSINSSQVKVKITARDNVNNIGSDESNATFTIDSTPPIVSVISPNGGENWIGNTTHEITWTVSDNFELATNPISIYYTTGEGYILIAENEPNDGFYSWTVPKLDSNTIKVKIVAADKAGNTASDESNATFAISVPPVVTLLSPNGGEKIAGNSTYSITWIATDEGGGFGPTPITLKYSIDGTNWNLIAENEANDGIYLWTVPAIDSSSVKIKIEAVDQKGNTGSDESDLAFMVDSSSPLVTVSYPNGGELIKGGATTTITWHATDEGSGIADNSIALYYNAGATDVLIAENLPNTGSYNWTVPTIDSKQVKIKVRARDNVGENGEDLSDGTFEIDSTPPSPPTVNPVRSPTLLLSQVISGTKTTDAVSILINGSSRGVAHPTSTTWTYNASLSKGINTFNIKARDAAGNDSSAVVATIEVRDLTFPDTDTGGSVTVPAGAASEEVDNINFEWVDLPGANPRGTLALERAIEITSNVNSFLSPISITLPKPSGAFHPRAFIWDSTRSKWLAVPIRNSTDTSLIIDSDCLGIFVVLDLVDFEKPTVADFKVNGRSVSSGDSIISKPSLSFVINDNYGVDSSQTFISVDGSSSKALSQGASEAMQVGTSVPFTYTFSDTEKLSPGNHTFKIMAADEVGNVSTWEATLYVLGDSTTKLVVYPNPCKVGGMVTFEAVGLGEDITVRVYDISGTLVWSGKSASNSWKVTWDTKNSNGNSVVPGVYLYVVTTNSGGKQSGKLAIIR